MTVLVYIFAAIGVIALCAMIGQLVIALIEYPSPPDIKTYPPLPNPVPPTPQPPAPPVAYTMKVDEAMVKDVLQKHFHEIARKVIRKSKP